MEIRDAGPRFWTWCVGACVLAVAACGVTSRLASALWTFFMACVPSRDVALIAGPICLAWSTACLWCAGWLKRHQHLATGYSRKIFHVLTFASVGGAHLVGGLPAVCVLGGATTMVLAYTIARGAGHPFYEALARESDAPDRTYYIVTSYVATLIGGVCSNVLAGPAALLGYLACGLGDAAGEPIGTRWGQHWYAVPTLRHGRTAQRSLEGSGGVFIVSLLAVAAGVAALTGFSEALHAWPAILAMAMACTVVEAISPHGWDNATMQLAPSLLAALLLFH